MSFRVVLVGLFVCEGLRAENLFKKSFELAGRGCEEKKTIMAAKQVGWRLWPGARRAPRLLNSAAQVGARVFDFAALAAKLPASARGEVSALRTAYGSLKTKCGRSFVCVSVG